MNKFPINIVLEDIRSALNVGAIFRTCEAGNIDTLYLTGITPYPPHNRIPKTALGSIEKVNWMHTKDKTELFDKLKSEGKKLYAVELSETAENIFEKELEFPAAFIFGNEITGVSEQAIEKCDGVLYIPMYGTKESLNVATVCGIVIYEVIRKINSQKISVIPAKAGI